MCSIGALYFWLFVYFITLEEGNRELTTADKILLVILLFCAPQLTLHSWQYNALKCYAEQIDEDEDLNLFLETLYFSRLFHRI